MTERRKKTAFRKLLLLVCVMGIGVWGWGQTIAINSSLFFTGTYSKGGSITAPIKVSGCFDTTNQFKMYLSDASGNFTSGGTLIGGYNNFFSTFVNGKIPSSTPNGNYKIRIETTNPIKADTSNSFVVNSGLSTIDNLNVSLPATGHLMNDSTYGNCLANVPSGALGLQLLLGNLQGATLNAKLYDSSWNLLTTNLSGSTIQVFPTQGNYYTLVVNLIDGSGTESRRSFLVYYTAHQLSFQNDGITEKCFPVTQTYTINILGSDGIRNNYPGTIYKLTWGDNTSTSYSHCQVISSGGVVTHDYTSSSCGKPSINTNSGIQYNAYQVSLSAKDRLCSNFADLNTYLKVFKKPVADFTYPATACINTSVTFTNTSQTGPAAPSNGQTCTTSNLSYYWFVDGSFTPASTSVSFTTTFTTLGNHTIKLLVENAGTPCNGEITKTICIQPQANAAFTVNGLDSVVDCAPKTIIINNTTPVGLCTAPTFTWQVSLESTPTVAILPTAGIYTVTPNLSAQNPTFVFNTPGRYIIKLSTSNSCSPPSSITKKIIMLGTTGLTLPANVTYCANGKTIDFGTDINHKPTYSSSGAGEIYNWSISGGAFSYVSGSSTSAYPVISFTDNTTYTVNLTFTNNCGTNTKSQTITFLSAVTANVGVNPKAITVCYNDNTLQLNGTATGGYSSVLWSSNRNGTFSNSGILNPVYTFGTTDRSNLTTRLILTITPNNNSCQVVKDTLNIIIRPQNTVTSNSTKPICSGSNVSYTPVASQTGSTFSWTSTTVTGTVTGLSATGTGNINDVLINTSNSSAATVKYTIIPIKDGCNGDAFDFTVTINPKPVLTATPTAAIICSGQALTVNLSSTASSPTYTWSSTANGNISGNTNQATATSNTSFTHNLSTTSTTDVTLTYTINSTSNSCAADAQTVIITVKPGVSTSNAGADQKLCNATTATLTGNSPTVGTGTWTQVGTPTVTIANSSLNNTGISGLIGNNTYRFVWTIAGTGSCPNSTDTVDIINRPAITIANAGADDKVCDFTTTTNKTYTLAANLDGTRNYETGAWTFVSAQNGASLSSNTSPTATITFANAGTYELKWTISNGGACNSTSDNVIIKVFAKPVGGTTASNISVCKNNNSGSINLTGKTGTVTKWQYAIGNSNIWNDTNVVANSINYLNLDTTRRYRAMIESDGKADGCLSIDSSTVTTITVDAETVAGNTLKDTAVCGTTNSGSIALTNYVGSITKWEFSTDNGSTWSTVAPANTTATLNFSNLTTTTKYRAVVKSGSCSSLNSTVSTVTVNAGTSSANAGPDAKLCSASSYAMQGSAPSIGSGTWTQVGTPNVTIQSPTSPTTNITGLQPNNTYTFVFTIAGFASCPTTTDTLVLINRPPLTQAQAGNDSIICNFTTTTNNQLALNGNGTSLSFETGTWSIISQPTSGNGTFSNNHSATSNFTFSKAGTYTLQWEIGNDAATCPSTKDTVVIKVIDKVVAGTLSATSLNICSGNPVTITNQNYTGQVQLWQFKRPYTQTNWTDTLVQSATITFNNVTDTFIVRSKVVTLDSLTCTVFEYTTQIQINVAPPSSPGTTGTNKTECKGSNNGTIALTGYTGNIVRWESSTNNGTTWTSIVNNTASQAYNNLNATTWYRAVVQSGTCSASFSTVTIITIVNPVTAPNAGLDQNLCNSTTVILTANTPASNETGTWSLVSGNPITFSATNTPATTISGLQVGSYTFKWTIDNSICPAQNDLIDVIVYPSITNEIDTATVPVCATQAINVTGQTPTGGNASYTYVWQQSTDNITWTNMVPAQTGSNLTFTPTANIYVRRVITANPCTSNSLSKHIIVQPAITNNTASTDQSICVNTSAAAIIGSTPTGGNGVFSYQWQQSIDNAVTWIAIGTATAKDYSPGVLTITTKYRRIVSTNLCFGPQGNTSNVITITVNPDAKALYTFTKDKDCAPFNINGTVITPTLYPSQNSLYNWYANGTSIGAGTIFPGYVLAAPGDSTIIKLVTISQFGCKNDSMEHKFYSVPKPATAFTLSDTVGCGPLTVSFVNITPNPSWFTYLWNFGNGVTSTLVQPNAVTFATNPTYNDTTYIVKLNAITACETVTFSKNVRVKSKPKAIFTPDKSTGCSPMTVQFANSSKGMGVSYIWNFDDGSASVPAATNAAQTHTFITGVQDTFNVKLIAMNECGNDTLIYKIVVAPNTVRLDFAVNGNQTQGCKPHTVGFINASSGATTFQWNFGDGNLLNTIKNIDTVQHTYTQAGTYTVILKASNGCSDTTSTETIQVFNSPTANFTAVPLTACIGDAIQFTNLTDTSTSLLWNFRDNSTSTLTNPTHAYTVAGTYNVQLKAFRQYSSGLTCLDSISKPVTIVSKQPGVFIASDTTSTCVPFTVTFTNQSLPSSNTTWDFGNGNSATGNIVTYTYTQVGTYTVKMNAISPGGCNYEATKTIIARGPTGTWQYDHGNICNTPVQFSTNATGTDSIRYNFGDGSFLTTTANPVYHNYTQAGSYVPTATLYSSSSAACTVLLQGIDTIKIDYVKAGYKFTKQENCGSTILSFTDTSRHYLNITSWQWKFGDGGTSTLENPSHTYLSTNTYVVQLITTTISGCSDTATYNIFIKINDKPSNTITASLQGCASQAVTYTANNVSIDPIAFNNWSFSNNFNTTGAIVTNTYNATGTYIATLISGTTFGCTDTATQSITINPTPIITAPNDQLICKGQSLPLTATSAATITWAPINGTLSCTACATTIATPLTTTQYIAAGTNSFGCSGKDSVIITVAQPIDIIASPNDTICIGSSSQLNVTGATTYAWTPAATLAQPNTAAPVATPTLTTTYRVIGFDSHNCFQDTAYVTVAVGQYPTISLAADQTLATGTKLPLISTFTNGPITNWQWSPATDLSCSTCPQPIATVKKQVCYSVTASNLYKCSAKDTICIKVFCEGSQVFIPNGFTPDGDGVNDILMVRGSGIKTVRSFRIFNRWGQVVFERTNISPNDAAQGWDGKINGKPAPPEVYVYTCEVTCDNDVSYTYKGNVAILK